MNANAEIQPTDFAFVYLDVDDPTIAWLVYRGLITSPDIGSNHSGNLSWFLLDVIKRGMVSSLRREGALEGFRTKEYPHLISRLRCVYAYPTLDAAKRGNYGRGKFRQENLVAIAPTSRDFLINSHDSNWINDFDALPIDTARRYWSGENTKSPLPESLLSGRFLIYGTTVRSRAYETIKRNWPNSLAMLELSRLAVAFGSDLGTISPWLKREGDRIIVSTKITYTEQEGNNVFRQTIDEAKRDSAFSVNWNDIKPLCDASSDPALDEKFCVPDIRYYEHELRRDKLDTLNEFIELVLARSP